MQRSPRDIEIDSHGTWLARRLAAGPSSVLTFYAAVASFCAYFCMYGFRKPFSAATYAGMGVLNDRLGLKTALVIAQVLGYTASKFAGIKVCSEVTARRRGFVLLGLVAFAEVALLIFAMVPPGWKVVALFFNGLALGMVWGLVVGYLEGRRTSEILLAALSCSFIVSSGAVKDVGGWLMQRHGISEGWMPVATGAIFLPAFAFSVWMLEQIPRPSARDVLERVERKPMDSASRISFIRQFFPGLILLMVAYFFLTAYRDFRDNFGVEILSHALHHKVEPGTFSRTELPVGFGVMAALALLSLVRSNRQGLAGAFALMVGGFALIGVATLLFDVRAVGPLTWMTLTGLGVYLAYVPFGSVLFDRLIAYTRCGGTAVFAIYLSDSIGYTGAVAVLLYKELVRRQNTPFGFFRSYSYFVAIVGTLFLVSTAIYLLMRRQTADASDGSAGDSLSESLASTRTT